MSVKAKKHLGQHFLTDESIAQQIADSLIGSNYNKVLEIGPGMGVLTKYLLEKPYETFVVEIDKESVEYLQVALFKIGEQYFLIRFFTSRLANGFQKRTICYYWKFPI